MTQRNDDAWKKLLSRIDSIGGEFVHYTAPHNWPSLVAGREGWDDCPAAGLKASDESVAEAVLEWADVAGYLAEDDEDDADDAA